MNYTIIVAGGKGLRMGADLPKQFLPVGGCPVLMRTIERFHEYDPSMQIILVLPRDHQPYWRELCQKHQFTLPHRIADGGDTRFASSLSGLNAIPDNAEGLVAIHDGVRPFVSVDTIGRSFDEASRSEACIPVLPVTDTLRLLHDDGTGENVLRSRYRSVQTPQVFDIQLAKHAFRQPYDDAFTDDASVIERLGHTVTMVDGNRENIKLTTPFDLKLAQFIIQN